eukprot:m.6083 g.6083  ORF g.6083 m.6083 type:complete len:442 (-) comp3481_c0_seq1:1630-2955(-)
MKKFSKIYTALVVLLCARLTGTAPASHVSGVKTNLRRHRSVKSGKSSFKKGKGDDDDDNVLGDGWCATRHYPHRPVDLDDMLSPTERRGRRVSLTVEELVIPIQFVSITSSTGEGAITREQVQEQVNILTGAFAGDQHNKIDMEIRFTLDSYSLVKNDTWFWDCRDEDVNEEFSNVYSKPLELLTIFSCDPGATTLGWSSLVDEYEEDDTRHSVVLNYAAVPGGSNTIAGYNLGDAAVHEIGHYVGLLHTFHLGCEDGDGVSDTPPERIPAFTCDLERDTCLDDDLKDPVQNFMDYTPDACVNQFTDQQGLRMHASIARYKPTGYSKWKNNAKLCGSGQFIDSGKCTNFTNCSASQYESGTANVVRDRICSDLTQCSSPSNILVNATATSDRICDTVKGTPLNQPDEYGTSTMEPTVEPGCVSIGLRGIRALDYNECFQVD